MKWNFSENNSGGNWWLERKDYEALFAAGWTYEKSEGGFVDDEKPFLGGEVPYGWRRSLYFEAPTLREAVESWEKATGKDFFDEGCNCCGAPFTISGGEGKSYEYISGDSVERTPIRPW